MYNILDISIYDIQMFLSVAQERNFSKAAERMNMSQPTLSKRISTLEELLGFPLFDRKQRPIALTEVGKVLYVEWEKLEQGFAQSVEQARSAFTQSAYELKIGMIDSGRSIEATKRATRMTQEAFPNATVSWVYRPYIKWKELILNGEVDLMLMLSIEESNVLDSMESRECYRCPKLLAMLHSNPLSKKEAITYEDLREQRFIINSPQVMPAHYEFIRKHTLAHGFEPKVARFTTSTHDLIGNLMQDDEVVVCDVFLRDVDSKDYKVFELPETYSGMLAVWRKDNPNPLLPSFVTALEEMFKLYPPSF